jgi:hypothetical protein
LYIITTDVSAPENRNKVITLAVNKEIPGVTSIKLDFEIVRGLDANKFTLVDNKLTFEAPAFNDRTDATYRVKIKATFAENSGAFPKTETAEKTLTVTIINADLLSLRTAWAVTLTFVNSSTTESASPPSDVASSSSELSSKLPLRKILEPSPRPRRLKKSSL